VAARLLSEGRVKTVLGYALGALNETVPCFIKRAEDTKRLVWNARCFHNLATYLPREHMKKHFPMAVVVKGCDRRAVNMLLKESMITRENVVLVGVPCGGMGEPLLHKCLYCEVRKPEDVDEAIPGEPAPIETPREGRFDSVTKLEQLEPDALWEQWKGHVERCIRCYACRQACPLCYCKRCIAEKTQPQWIESSPHLRGNFAWNVVRAFHLFGRCVGCGECERVCPAGIPLGEINSKLAKTVRERFVNYQAGMDAVTPSPFTTYDLGIDNDEGIL